ncbi:hypothetical protein [Streptomyces sp. NPDC006879]|uniref:hypothetical protein n=1 Tax=Streptomyces sp. NPDC006879 TaxID=3364767 RepID=UPI0036B01A78
MAGSQGASAELDDEKATRGVEAVREGEAPVDREAKALAEPSAAPTARDVPERGPLLSLDDATTSHDAGGDQGAGLLSKLLLVMLPAVLLVLAFAAQRSRNRARAR